MSAAQKQSISMAEIAEHFVSVDLNKLLGYLQATLDAKNRLWLAAHLMQSKEETRPYTREELIARVENAEKEIAAGQFYTEEEVDAEVDAMLNDLEVAEAKRDVLLKQWQVFKNGGNVKLIKINK